MLELRVIQAAQVTPVTPATMALGEMVVPPVLPEILGKAAAQGLAVMLGLSTPPVFVVVYPLLGGRAAGSIGTPFVVRKTPLDQPLVQQERTELLAVVGTLVIQGQQELMVTQGRRVLRGMRVQPLQVFVNPSLAAMVVRAAQPETVVLLAIRGAQETQAMPALVALEATVAR